MTKFRETAGWATCQHLSVAAAQVSKLTIKASLSLRDIQLSRAFLPYFFLSDRCNSPLKTVGVILIHETVRLRQTINVSNRLSHRPRTANKRDDPLWNREAIVSSLC